MTTRARGSWRLWWIAIWAMAWVNWVQVAGAQAGENFADRPTPLENWQVLSALILPLVMAFIIQSHWSRGAQAVATMAVSLVWTFIAKTLSDDTIVIPQMIVQALELFALTIPMYYGVWKPLQVTQKIEAATNFTEEGKTAARLRGTSGN